MNKILDTHTLIWFFEGSHDISNLARKQIEDPAFSKFVSVASFWEIAIKISIGKLEMDLSMEDLTRLVWKNDFELIPIKIEHTYLLRTLPFHHKDPFDRLIISQSLTEKMDILSRDIAFDPYLNKNNIKRVW